MASHQRNERLLMRQRGAGRDVPVTDFGLNFAFPITRASGRSSRSRSKTPSNKLAPRMSQSWSSRKRQSIAARSRRSASIASRAASVEGDTAAHEDTAHPAKRRKTIVHVQTLQELQQAPDPNDDYNSVQEIVESESPVGTAQLDGPNDKENDAPGTQKAPLKKKKKRKSIGQSSLFKKKRSSTESAKGEPTSRKPATLSKLAQERALDLPHSAATEDAEQTMDESEDDEYQDDGQVLEAPETSAPKIVRTKRKRKSITYEGQNKKKRNSREARRQSSQLPLGLDEENSVAESAQSRSVRNERKSASLPQASSSRGPSPLPSLEVDNSEDEYVEEDDSPEPRTPVPRSKAPNTGKAKTKGNTSTASRSKSGFPILTHRMANAHMLPRIDEAGESDLDSEDERAREAELKSTIDRPVPNVVDVLAQYCRETVEAAVQRLDAGIASNRAERKRKQTALQRVGQELDDRLYEMSTAIEARIQLEAQARRAKREKSQLQARWLDIRRQREEIALRCDGIRQQNWERERNREAKWTISEAAQKLELEVERNNAPEEESLEYMLRTVAADVSNSHGDGGLLERIKSFNSQLEHMAGVLEGRM